MDWDVFWSVLVVTFIAIPLFLAWVFALADLLTRPDLSGIAKAIWFLGILFLPLLGTLLYYLFRPWVHETRYGGAAHAGYVAEKLTQLADLRDRGVISNEDFQRQRDRLLAA